MLEVRRLRLLRELSLRGTIANVAEALNQTPSSVSQQLAQFEREAGVALLRKSGRRLQLTPQAEILVEQTAEILTLLERAESDMNASLRPVRGTVRIAAFQSAALALMPEALNSLSRDYPLLRVEMTQREPEEALRETWARDFDLVIAEQYPHHAAPHYAELDRRHLASDSIRLASSLLPGRFGAVRALSDAATAPWVMEPVGSASRHWAEQACRSAGFEPDVRFETADLQAHIQLVQSGNAVALIPDLVWTGRATSVQLTPLPGDPKRTIFTSSRLASSASPLIVACRKSLELAAQLIGVRETGAFGT